MEVFSFITSLGPPMVMILLAYQGLSRHFCIVPEPHFWKLDMGFILFAIFLFAIFFMMKPSPIPIEQRIGSA